MAQLLLDEYPLIVLPSLAEKIGLNQAIFLQQIHYWIGQNRNIQDGKSWVYNSYEEWQKQFPFWSVRTIKRIVSELEISGLLVSSMAYSKVSNRKKWYTIDYDKFNLLCENTITNKKCVSLKDKKIVQSQSENISDFQEPSEKELNELSDKFLSNLDEIKNGENFSLSDNSSDAIGQIIPLDSDNLSHSIVSSCHDPLCQDVPIDSDKIVIPSYITDNTTENSVTENTITNNTFTEIISPSSIVSCNFNEKEKQNETKENEKKLNIDFDRLYKLFKTMHYSLSENEKRRLFLLFKVNGEAATEYAILCSEGKKFPIGYIIAVLKDKNVIMAFKKGENENDVKLETGKHQFNIYNGFGKYKKTRNIGCLPATDEESVFRNAKLW